MSSVSVECRKGSVDSGHYNKINKKSLSKFLSVLQQSVPQFVFSCCRAATELWRTAMTSLATMKSRVTLDMLRTSVVMTDRGTRGTSWSAASSTSCSLHRTFRSFASSCWQMVSSVGWLRMPRDSSSRHCSKKMETMLRPRNCSDTWRVVLSCK